MNKIISEEAATSAKENIAKLHKALADSLFGIDEVISLLITALLANGHILLEGLPGLGKTELIKALGKALNLEMKRVQFTPDLLPGDITGIVIFDDKNQEERFSFQRGPVFTNLLLADEINRASPKTQSALLEAMQEGKVTSLGKPYLLPNPFFVLATQNPIELEGTYPLPEAQLDRFLFKIHLSMPNTETLEQIITNKEIGIESNTPNVMTGEELTSLIGATRQVFLPTAVKNYIARLVNATHPNQSKTSKYIQYGASPRAALSLAAAARASALLKGRINTSFDDVKKVAIPTLQHRVLLTHSARIDGMSQASIIDLLLDEIEPLESNLPNNIATKD